MRLRRALVICALVLPVATLAPAACLPSYEGGGPGAEAGPAEAGESGPLPESGLDAGVDGTTDGAAPPRDGGQDALPGDDADGGPAATTTLAPIVLNTSFYQTESCALDQGSYRCWGDQDCDPYGELGFLSDDGGAIVPPVPMPASPQGTPSQMVLGFTHRCSLYARAAYCRGSQDQLGNESGDGGFQELPVLGLPEGGVDRLAVGLLHTCALTAAGSGAEGNVYCWGWNIYGQCGRPTTDDTSTATPVILTNDAGVGSAAFSNATILALGGHHTCAATGSATAYCWGTTTRDESGPEQGKLCDPFDYTYCNPDPQPVPMPDGANVTGLALGYDHSCALTEAGHIYCWGSNQFGQLAVASLAGTCTVSDADAGNTVPCTSTPTLVPSLPTMKTISAGVYHTCGIDQNQYLWCWGNNDDAQLGVGDYDDHVNPVQVLDATLHAPIQVDWVAAGGLRTCAHSTAGQVLCWGSGELSTERPDAAPPPDVYPAPVLF